MRLAGAVTLLVASLVAPQVLHAAAPAVLDTLDVHTILERRTMLLDSLLTPESTRLDTVGTASLADSLDRGGAAAIHAHAPETTRAPRRLSFSLRPGQMSTYNRVDGLRLGSGGGARVPGIASLTADAAYGISSERWQGAALLSVHPFGSGPANRRPALELGWSDQVLPFGPNQGEYFTSLGALVAGQDRQDYLRQRSYDVRAVLRRTRRSSVALGGFVHEDHSVESSTDFAFFGGGTPIFEPNPSIDPGRTHALLFVAEAKPRGRKVGGRLEAGVAGAGLGGDFEYSWQDAKLFFVPRLGDGSVVRTRLWAMNTAGTPPVQSAAYVGGDGNLRGYERLEFAGKRSLTARLDFEWGRDLFAHTGIPYVRRLQLQFIPHVDAGTTWGEVRGVDKSGANLDGAWRSAVGIGILRNTGYPGIASLRFDISWRTDGNGENPTVWFRVGNLDFGDED